jgi:hypothetical protein
VLSEQLSKTSSDVYADGQTVGANAANGVAAGITKQAQMAIRAAKALANAVSDTMRNTLQIASPSRVMMELGSYVSQGFAEGIESQLDTVNRAAERMADSVNVSPSMNGGSVGRNGGMIDVTLMIGPDQLAEIMTPLMDNSIGGEVMLVRR